MPKLICDPKETRDAEDSTTYGTTWQRAQRKESLLFNFGYCGWLPELLPSGNDSTLWNRLHGPAWWSFSLPSDIDRKGPADRRRLRGTDLPPELFEYICKSSDGGPKSFRLVCKYWEQQARPLVFSAITLRMSLQRMEEFLELLKDPASLLVPHVKFISAIPPYTARSKFPFLHLLGQVGVPLNHNGSITVRGPFRKSYRTIRSIHFAVPRSLPQSFSRGVRSLSLLAVHFQRHEDMTSLVSELPDLVDFRCHAVTFGSYPDEPLRRRPRKSRNNLEDVIFNCGVIENKQLPYGYHLLSLNPFLAVYNSASIFDDGEAAVIRALLPLKRLVSSYLHGHYEYDPKCEGRLFESGDDIYIALRAQLGYTVIYCFAEQLDTDMSGWSQVAAACESLSRPPQFVIGARTRQELFNFNANVVEKMPSLFKPEAVRYSLQLRKKGWFIASLDSDELQCEGKQKLTDVYP